MGGGGEGLRRNGKDGRPRARTGACTPARDEKRECPRDEVRGIAREEKLRFTDRGTLTKRKWSSRERGGNSRDERGGYKRKFLAFSFLHSSSAARLILFYFSLFKIERINMSKRRARERDARGDRVE